MIDDPEFLALYQTILANPKDDAPRWIISDWLEEHDHQLFAEFIRFQLDTEPILDKAVRRHDYFSDIAEFIRFSFKFRVVELAAFLADISNSKFGLPEVVETKNQSQQFWLADSSPTNLPTLFQKLMPQSINWQVSPITLHQLPTGTDAFIVRGFVQAVQLKMANLMIHAAELFRQHPIEIIEVPDKQPGIVDDDISKGFGWIYSNNWADPDETHALPREIFDCLPKSMIELPPSVMPRWHDETRAIAALRQACVNYGRKLAGLPPIKLRPEF